MKRAILLRFVAILMLALAVSSVFSYYFIGKNMLKSNRESMLNTIHVVDYSLNYDGDLQEQLSRLHEATMDENSRVTIIGEDGTVVADNEIEQVDSLENHLEREEVKEALRSGSGFATRNSESLGENMLYVAVHSKKGPYVVRMAVPYTNMLDYMILIFPVLLLGTGIAFAMSVVIAVRFTNTITTPLNEISREMEKVRSDNPSFTFKTYKYKELNVISATTMKMAEEIREHMDRLEKEKRIRQEFFSNASHELKTPITSIQGYAELLESGMIQDDGMKLDFARRIKKEAAGMTGLINDILMISRLESMDAEVMFSDVRISVLLQEIMDSLKPLAASCQVFLHVDVKPLCIRANLQQMKELFTNLATNAIKYNRPGGQVWITVGEQGDDMLVRVKDNGVGIPKESLDRIFERFYRVDKGRSRKQGGTGLGLSIVKHIVNFYHGTIHVTSELDKGTEFTVTIPLDMHK